MSKYVIHPSIKDVYFCSAKEPGLDSPDSPSIFRVDFEMGDQNPGVMIYSLFLVNAAWTSLYAPGLALHGDYQWLPIRAHIFLKCASLQEVVDLVAEKMKQGAPFKSWKDFSQFMYPYLIWEIEGAIELQEQLEQ